MLIDKPTRSHPHAVVIGKIIPPTKGPQIHYDHRHGDAPDKVVRGFGLRVTPAGAKAFILNYRTKSGQERRLTIGGWPDWRAADARQYARELRVEIDKGRDPLGERDAERDAPTVKRLAEKYKEKPAKKASVSAAE